MIQSMGKKVELDGMRGVSEEMRNPSHVRNDIYSLLEKQKKLRDVYKGRLKQEE